MKDCRKRKNVAAARVPSLVSVAGDALVVPGKIGDRLVKAMLCDSGATICVVAEELLPEGTEKLERVWIGTVGMDPKPYPTVAVPAEVNGKKLEGPVKKILNGAPPEQAAGLDALANPESLRFFVELADSLAAGGGAGRGE